jgi:hypothetical protein
MCTWHVVTVPPHLHARVCCAGAAHTSHVMRSRAPNRRMLRNARNRPGMCAKCAVVAFERRLRPNLLPTHAPQCVRGINRTHTPARTTSRLYLYCV